MKLQCCFYAKVIFGTRMPNFVYMPSFSSVDDRNAHWKTFGNDPDWKAMQAKPEYENKVSVSRIESILMKAAEYSDM
ncbi:MAG: NIPSNAP family protein [Flavisolibacter sp.]